MNVGPQNWTRVNMGTIYVARHSKSVVNVGPRDWTRVIVGTIEIVRHSEPVILQRAAHWKPTHQTKHAAQHAYSNTLS